MKKRPDTRGWGYTTSGKIKKRGKTGSKEARNIYYYDALELDD